MHINPFRRNKVTCNTENGTNRELVYKTCFERTCFEVFILSDKECMFLKNYRFVSDKTPSNLISYCVMPAIAKKRIVSMAYLDFLCTLVDPVGLGDLCGMVSASDDKDTHILSDDDFQVFIKHKGVEIFHDSNRLNYKALRDKQVIQEIKSLFFDIDSFFNTIFDMSDDQLVENEAMISAAAARYWSKTQ